MRLELKMPERIIFEEGCLKELDGCAAELGDNIFYSGLPEHCLKRVNWTEFLPALGREISNIPFLTGLRGSRLPKWWMMP